MCMGQCWAMVSGPLRIFCFCCQAMFVFALFIFRLAQAALLACNLVSRHCSGARLSYISRKTVTGFFWTAWIRSLPLLSTFPVTMDLFRKLLPSQKDSTAESSHSQVRIPQGKCTASNFAFANTLGTGEA